LQIIILIAVKKQGADCFRQKNYKGAIELWLESIKKSRSINYKTDDEVFKNIIACYNNIAIASYDLQQYHDTIKYTKDLFDYDPNNLKGLFRRCKALIALENYSDAQVYITRFMQNPKRKAAGNEK